MSASQVDAGVVAQVLWREATLPLPLAPTETGAAPAAVVHGSVKALALRHCSVAGNEYSAMARVVIAPALGVPQRYYTAFAQWLAQQGFAVTTWDYFGHGASLQGPLRAVQTSLLDWAQDCAAVAQHLRLCDAAHGVQRQVLWVGHSVGAQLPGLSPQPLPIDGLLAIASGSGYWRDNAPPTKRKVWLFWGLLAPLLTAVYGYLPGKRWGMVGDLPAGVLWQWRRWCLHPEYALGVEGDAVRQRYAASRYPVRALAMADDEMMSPRSIAALLSWYGEGAHPVQTLHAAQAGGQRMGHLGFFRPEFAQTLWPLAVQPLHAWVQAGVAGSMSGNTPGNALNTSVAPAGQAGGGGGATVGRSSTPVVRMPPHAAPGQGDLFSEAL